MTDTTARKIIGVLGGSFNPVHTGHIGLAEWIACHGGVDGVWLSLSPASPFKRHDSMLPDALRLAMLREAVKDCDHLRVTDVELSLPHPSYTADALAALSRLHPDKDFRLIIGGDNLAAFDRWRRWEEIVGHYGLVVYPRPGYPFEFPAFLMPHCDNITVLEACPSFDISSTEIRRRLECGDSLAGLVNPGVETLLRDYLAANA